MHTVMKHYICLAALLFSSPAFAVTIEAPGGLKWGETITEIKSKGVTFEECTPTDNAATCKTKKVPKSLSFADFYQLIFVDDRLQKVLITGTTIENDPYGTEGKNLYSKINSQLTDKYGTHEDDSELDGLKLYTGRDEFYQCLAYRGCGLWAKWWSKDGVVVVRLHGIRRGKGWLEITYESPKWSEISDSFNAAKDANDADGL